MLPLGMNYADHATLRQFLLCIILFENCGFPGGDGLGRVMESKLKDLESLL